MVFTPEGSELFHAEGRAFCPAHFLLRAGRSASEGNAVIAASVSPIDLGRLQVGTSDRPQGHRVCCWRERRVREVARLAAS